MQAPGQSYLNEENTLPTTQAPTGTTPKMTPGARKAVFAGVLGNLIEWYDYALYGAAAGIVLGPLFFKGDSAATTLAAFATFAVGFAVRPVGGLIIANFGDKVGRKPALLLTVTLMGIATVSIGLLPTYDQIGMWAPALLIFFRALQGFGAGAELAGALTLVSEYVSPRRRGLVTGMVNGMGGGGTLLSTFAFFAVSALPKDAFMTWGWRLPFLASIILFFLAMYIRRTLEETPEYRATAEKRQSETGTRAPILTVFKSYPRNTISGMLVWTGHNCNYYLTSTFALAFITSKNVGMDLPSALTAVMIASFLHVITAPLFGMLGDKIGYRQVFAGAMIFCMAWAYPFFLMLKSGDFILVTIALIIGYAGVSAATNGSAGAFTANLFPTRYRYSGIAVSKEFNAAAIGGTAPLIATALILAANGDVWLVAVYSALLSLITVVGIVVAGRGVGNTPVEDPEDAFTVESTSAPAAAVIQ